MKEFEFLFFYADGTIATDHYRILSNYTAILAGETRANGRRFEIWCADVCIFNSDIENVGSLAMLDRHRQSSNK